MYKWALCLTIVCMSPFPWCLQQLLVSPTRLHTCGLSECKHDTAAAVLLQWCQSEFLGSGGVVENNYQAVVGHVPQATGLKASAFTV